MAEHRRLKSPPIVEAVIDLRVRLKEPIEASSLANATPSFKAAYVKAGVLKQRAFEFNVNSDAPNVSTEVTQGVRFDNDSGSKAAIFTQEGFTFSHLNSYSDWGALKADAIAAWNEFLELAKPTEILRVGIRYINRIDLPAVVDFDDFFTSVPSVPPALPQYIGPFFSRVVFPLSGISGLGSLTHVHADSVSAETSVILDIDIYQDNVSYDARGPQIWEILDSLRDQKNKVFFAAITEKTLEKYL